MLSASKSTGGTRPLYHRNGRSNFIAETCQNELRIHVAIQLLRRANKDPLTMEFYQVHAHSNFSRNSTMEAFSQNGKKIFFFDLPQEFCLTCLMSTIRTTQENQENQRERTSFSANLQPPKMRGGEHPVADQQLPERRTEEPRSRADGRAATGGRLLDGE